METTGLVALSLEVALRKEMNVVANNIANANTPGFKSERVLFREALLEAEGFGPSSRPLKMVEAHGTFKDFSDGALTQTNAPLDLALDGPGFLAVETDNGIRYTRGGAFQLDNERQIVTRDGYPLLDDGDRPLVVPVGDSSIVVAPNGSISSETGIIGLIPIYSFERPNFLKVEEAGLYKPLPGENPRQAEETRMLQGAIEQSNVQPITEVARMIDVLRRYQAADKLGQEEDDRQITAIRTLGRLDG